MFRKIKLKANAKINLTLSITGKREDGYHLIDTVMQNISLFDTVADFFDVVFCFSLFVTLVGGFGLFLCFSFSIFSPTSYNSIFRYNFIIKRLIDI